MIPNLNSCSISKSRVLGSLQVVLEKMQGSPLKDFCLRSFAVQLESGSYVQNVAVSTSEIEIPKKPGKTKEFSTFRGCAIHMSTHKYKSVQVDYVKHLLQHLPTTKRT